MYLIYLPHLVLIVATIVFFATEGKTSEYARMACFAAGLVVLWDIGVK